MADTRPPRPPRDIRRRRHGAGVRSFAAVALAAGVLVAANALSAKGLYAHWGIRPHYALSERTQRVLADTEGELALCAAFERSHPFRTPARRLLREYAESARTFAGLHLTIREIDLNHDPVEAAALLRRFPSAANAVVVSYRGHDRVLDEYELAAPEGSGGDEAARFDGERAISAAILRLAHPVRRTVCFLSGHGEFDPGSDHPVGGASALSRTLALGGYEVRRLAGIERGVPSDCGVLVVAGPRTMFSAQDIESLSSFLSRGGRALVLVDDPHAAGLAPLLRVWGVELASAPGGPGAARASALEYAPHDAARDMDNVLTVFSGNHLILFFFDGVNDLFRFPFFAFFAFIFSGFRLLGFRYCIQVGKRTLPVVLFRKLQGLSGVFAVCYLIGNAGVCRSGAVVNGRSRRSPGKE